MANKQKLVFLNKDLAATKAWLKAQSTGTPDWTSPTNEFYRSLVFTEDGHLLTHGIDFNPVASLGPGLLFNPTAGVTNVSAPESDTDGAIPIFENQSGQWNVNWIDTVNFVMYPEDGFTSGQVLIGNGTNTPTTRAIVTTGASDTSGLMTENAVINNFIPYPAWTSDDTNQYVLIQTAAKTVTKYKLLDNIANIATTDTTSLLTGLAVKNAIADAFEANDAMQFAGTYAGAISEPTSGTIGGTFTTISGIHLGRGCTWRVSSSGYFGQDKVEVGDLIIAIQDTISATSDDDPSEYTIIQTNIDGALTVANINGQDGTGQFINKRAVYKDNTNKLYINQVFRKIQTNNEDVVESTNLNPLWFDAGGSLSVSLGITNDKNTITYEINNSVPAQTTKGLYKIKHNEQGLITGSTSWTPNTLTLKEVVSSWDSYSGGIDKTYNPDGTSLSLQYDRGIIFYQENANGPILIGHSSSGATTVTAQTGTYISGLVIDSYGHVTGVTTDNDINTWRPVNAYLLSNGSKSASSLSPTPSSVGTADLTFGSEFVFAGGTEQVGSETGNEIHLVWAEVSSNGTITYAV